MLIALPVMRGETKSSARADVKAIAGPKLGRVVLKDRVLVLIKEAILSGRLEPGDRIVEMKIANDFGVATTSVREALFELESQGFVTRVTNKGTFVTELSKDDIAQIVCVRQELEGLAAELAEQRATGDDIAALSAIVDEMYAAARANDLKQFYRSDLEFHRAMWAMSGNRHLTKALDTTVVPLFAFFIMRNPSDSVAELVKSVAWHKRIVDAIAHRQGARKCMEEALRFFSQQENWMLFRTQDPAP
jgi:DNA-binding GntR family transcriptional regulator